MLQFLNPLIFDSLAVNFDLPILEWIQEHLQCGFLDFIMPIITLFGDAGIFWIACAAVMLLFCKTRKTGWSMGVALIFGLLLCNIFLKPAVMRPRPYDFQEVHFGKIITLLIHEHGDFSFPSGHTIASFEASVAILKRNKKLGIPALILAILIAFSRLYLYVHYPTDVIASVLLGTGLAFLGCFIVDKVYDLLPEKMLNVKLPWEKSKRSGGKYLAK